MNVKETNLQIHERKKKHMRGMIPSHTNLLRQRSVDQQNPQNDVKPRRIVKLMNMASQRSRDDGLIKSERFELVKYKNHPMEKWSNKYRRGMIDVTDENDHEETTKTATKNMNNEENSIPATPSPTLTAPVTSSPSATASVKPSSETDDTFTSSRTATALVSPSSISASPASSSPTIVAHVKKGSQKNVAAKDRQENSVPLTSSPTPAAPVNPPHIDTTKISTNQEKIDEENNDLDAASKFKPMRIQFFTDALDKSHASCEVYELVQSILPDAVDFWSNSLSVVPVDGPLRINGKDLQDGHCYHPSLSAVPQSHMDTGVEDADLVLYISATPEFCGEGTIAVAIDCNWDGYDRPLAGAVNVCVDHESFALNDDGTVDAAIVTDIKDVLIHEIGHVLGLSSNHYRFFRYPDGSPRTPRPFKPETVTCVNGKKESVLMPSKNTLDFWEDDRGGKYAAIVTEKVRTVAQNQFNCQSVPGGLLENQPTGESCFGAHWDERFAFSSTMSASVSPTDNFLTPMTLALYEDSGWYVANYSMSSISPWGHDSGCDFVNKACLDMKDDGSVTVPDFGKGLFCQEESERGCSPAHTHKVACTAQENDWKQWIGLINRPEEQFEEYGVGGWLEQVNYCPTFSLNFDLLEYRDLDCTNADNGDKEPLNIYDEHFGENSMCFETTTYDFDFESGYVHGGTGRCYKSHCDLAERALKVQLQGVWMTCEYDFQELKINSGPGATLTCPRLAQVCPNLFCPFNCAGAGICKFENEVDAKIQPKCECFDSSDTSPGCTLSPLILSSKYVKDSSELVDENIPIKESDHFWSIFKESPGSWSGKSWGYAIALFVPVFLAIAGICLCFAPRKHKKKVTRHIPQNIKNRTKIVKRDISKRMSSISKQI